MRKFKAELTTELSVEFSDPDKAKAYFIDGDWKNVFWDLDSMEDLVKSIVSSFHSTPEVWDGKKFHEKFPEGFGVYKNIRSDTWVFEGGEEIGTITVCILEDLYPSNCEEE